jgi:glucose/arabinose dehydrogenase
MRRVLGIVSAFLLLLVPDIRSFADQQAQEQIPNISLELVTSGLSEPVGVTSAGDGSRRLFVVEQDGRVRIVRKGRLKSRPFLDVTELTQGVGEQGLLGLAFHPHYEDNRRFFVHFTANNGDTVIAEYKRSRSHVERANENSQRILLTIDDPFPNHNGGDLKFGPDGFLYIALGDGGGGGDPQENAQALDTLLGKILRIDVNGTEGDLEYAVPADNPFVGAGGARAEIWSYGLRNPWRISFDSGTGDLWIGDVGETSVEEINVERAGSPGGVNYGWDVMEGTLCFEPEQGCDPTGLTPPVAEYRHNEGCSVTGGFVYRGQRFPELRGTYFYGDYCSGSIWALVAADPAAGATKILPTDYSISSFGETAAGEILVTAHGGRLFKIVVAE